MTDILLDVQVHPVLVSRGNIRWVCALMGRMGWRLSAVERWQGLGRGLACYCTFTRPGKVS